jgi:hypothetical protein
LLREERTKNYFSQMMSNREFAIWMASACILKILVVHRLFRDEKSPIPHLRPVSPHYIQPQNFSNLSQGVSVLVTDLLSIFLSNLQLRTYVALTLSSTRRARGSTPRIGNCYCSSGIFFWQIHGLNSTPPLNLEIFVHESVTEII